MKESHRYCVIMCGGIGSRFWPYSRTARPKQFIDFFGTGRSLLQMSYDRIRSVVDDTNIIVVTNKVYAQLVREQLPELDESQILCEPTRRNTAPAIAWAAYHIAARDPEASIVVTPSDHLITNENAFTDAIDMGLDFVERNDALLTLGIIPSRPETGYGYIQIGADADPGFRRVKTFTEKPNREMAEMFIATGEFFWNSGIFLWKARTIIDAIHEHAPELAEIFDSGMGKFNTPDENGFIAVKFPSCPSISIDYAVMEKASNVYVECVSFGWSDLGTWGSLYDNSPKNREANVTQKCRVLAYNSVGNIFATDSSDKLMVVAGLNDYIIADSEDVLLIYPRADEQDIKKVVDDAHMAFGDKFI